LSNPYLGEIRLLSFNFAPKGWAQCNGQLLAINQNQALFSLLGTQFGGNGVQNFALPDMRSRVPVHTDGGSSYPIGGVGGVENVALNGNQIPSHIHMAQAVNTQGSLPNPISHLLAQSEGTGQGQPGYVAPSNTTPLNPASIQPAGGGQPHSNIQPYLAMNYCIATQGIFPSRS
jgi:microcystin-dependent protein